MPQEAEFGDVYDLCAARDDGKMAAPTGRRTNEIIKTQTNSKGSPLFTGILAHLDTNLSCERFTLVQDDTQLDQLQKQLDVAACC